MYIPSSSIHKGPIVCGSAQFRRPASPLNRKATLCHYVHDDPPLSAGLERLCDDILERSILQGQIGIHRLQSAVLVFKFLQPLHVRGLQLSVLGFLLVVGGGTDSVRPPDLIARAAGIGPFQDQHNLCFGKLRLAHGNLRLG